MIQYIYLFNYSLPGESILLDGDDYPMNDFETSVDTRFNEEVKPSRHGLWNGNTWFGKRTWHFEGNILGDSAADYITKRRQLLRILTPKSHLLPNQPIGVMNIQFDGMSDYVQSEFTLESYPEIPITAQSPEAGPYQINLKSPDPRLYTTEKLQILQGGYSVVGRQYPKTYPKTYTHTVSLGGPENYTITNSGDIESTVRFRAYGPFNDPIFNVTRPDGSVAELDLWTLQVFSGAYLEVDFAKKTAYVYDVAGIQPPANVYSYVTNTWWALEPGDNLVTFYYTPVSGQPVVEAYWKDAYMI